MMILIMGCLLLISSGALLVLAKKYKKPTMLAWTGLVVSILMVIQGISML